MPSTLTAIVAGQVRAETARARLSSVQLAERIGRTQAYLARRLNGGVAFDLDDLAAISEVLGIPVSDLMGTPDRSAS